LLKSSTTSLWILVYVDGASLPGSDATESIRVSKAFWNDADGNQQMHL